jgi:RNA polymerase sigma-70 factor (ECF subfamily)
MTPARDNETWVKDLHASGAQRDAALAELRALLLRALPKEIARWLSPDNPEFKHFIEDTVQETLLRVLKGLDTFEGRSQFTTWVFKISVRVALNELRRRRWRDVSLDGLEEDDEDRNVVPRQFASSEPLPESVVERADILQYVQLIIEEELTPRQRAAMQAIHIQGVPMEEVAHRMGTNRNALYKLLHDARVRLKHRLEREGLSPVDLLDMFGQ